MKTTDKVQLLNEYYEAKQYYDDRIYDFDEYTFRELFTNPWEAMRATVFGDVNMGHDFFTFDGYGNIETLSDWKIDELFEDSDFQQWAIKNGHIEAGEEE